MDDQNSCWLILLPTAGRERLAQDCDQCLQGRKWQHIQPGSGGGLHVWRPNCPKDLPVETTTHCKNHVFLSKGTLLRCNVEKGKFFYNFFLHNLLKFEVEGRIAVLEWIQIFTTLRSADCWTVWNINIQFICTNKMDGCILNEAFALWKDSRNTSAYIKTTNSLKQFAFFFNAFSKSHRL